jgi:hypothetical protein
MMLGPIFPKKPPGHPLHSVTKVTHYDAIFIEPENVNKISWSKFVYIGNGELRPTNQNSFKPHLNWQKFDKNIIKFIFD